jgi:hypothetical protein
MTDRKWNDANRFEVVASFKSVANTSLARALYPILTWTSYDKHQAHMWALRMIKANPQTGADVAEALVNFDAMIPAARSLYDTNARDRAKWDKALAAFRAWKDEQEMAAPKAA